MFIPDDCPHLAGIKMSLPNHREELYKELETPRMERGYRWFLQALFSKAEEQLTNGREQVTGSESRRVVDHRYVEKGKSVIQVEDPVHENTNQVPNPRNQLEGIDRTPNVMGDAHVTRKLRKMVKNKNVVRGEQIDQGHLTQRSGPGNNRFPRKLSEHVEKGEAQGEKGSKRPAVIENRYERGYSAQRLKEGEEQSRKRLKKSPEELEESSSELVGDEGGKRFPQCKPCRNEVRNDEDYRICGHSSCPSMFYHVRCLTNKQLRSNGPCWYCPSCLCDTAQSSPRPKRTLRPPAWTKDYVGPTQH